MRAAPLLIVRAVLALLLAASALPPAALAQVQTSVVGPATRTPDPGQAPARAAARPRETGAAAGLARYGVFVWSSLCRAAGGAGLGGLRVTLIRAVDGDYVHVRVGDGFTSGEAAYNVSVNVSGSGGTLSFAYDVDPARPAPSGDSRIVTGALTATAFTGTISQPLSLAAGQPAPPRPVTLPRAADLGAPLPACAPGG